MCWYVPTCADMCRHVPACDITLGTYDTNRLELICIPICVSTCGHADMCWYVPTCADMCRHVPACDITLGTYDTNRLDLISMLACVSTCGHAVMCWYVPTCADMCQHVASVSAPLFPTIWTLSARWHVSAHMDMPAYADMCRHVLICADLCQHVASLSAPLIPTLGVGLGVEPFVWYVSAHMDMPTPQCHFIDLNDRYQRCRDKCHMSAHVGTYQYMSACPQVLIHASIQIKSKWSLSEVSRLMSHVGTCRHISPHVGMSTCADTCQHAKQGSNGWYQRCWKWLHM